MNILILDRNLYMAQAASSMTNELHVHNEKYITLSDGRQLAYAEQGNTESNKIFIFFHGVCGIGECSNENTCYKELGYHFIAPTLPGWGNSSPWPNNQPISNYPNDIHQLLSSLKKNNHQNLRIIVSGGSYGSAFAQICFGTSADIMPEIIYVESMIILSGFSPFKYHTQYSKSLTWSNYFAIGKPAIYFKFLPKLIGSYIKSQVQDIEKAKEFVQKEFFDKMGDDEKEIVHKWEEENNKSVEWIINMMSTNISLSISKTIAGYNDVAHVLHSDWGFDPKKLPSSPIRKVFILAAQDDKVAPMEMSTYLVENYPHAELKIISGGHIAAFFQGDAIIKNWLLDLDK